MGADRAGWIAGRLEAHVKGVGWGWGTGALSGYLVGVDKVLYNRVGPRIVG